MRRPNRTSRRSGWKPRKRQGTAKWPANADDDIETLREEAADCRACPLWKDATQTVFGEGPQTARIMLVGEQPGDKEDLAGKPFVGPAGQMLDRALEEAGIDRSKVYVTNAVKHFKFVPRGKIRLHQKPNTPEIKACRPWYERELAAIKPDLVVAMGATAAQSVFGKMTPVNKNGWRRFTMYWPLPSPARCQWIGIARQGQVLAYAVQLDAGDMHGARRHGHDVAAEEGLFRIGGGTGS